MFRRHYTDEQLLAFLDAELDAVSRAVVARHVHSCWTCRSRLSGLEEQVETLSSAWSEAGLHPRLEVEQARNRFLAWTRAGVFEFGRQGWWPPRFSAVVRAPVMAGIGAILLVGGVTVWELQQREEPAPAPGRQVSFASAPRPAPVIEPSRRAVRDVARIERPVVALELPIPEPSGPSESQLLETEMDAWWALHRAGACNGEPVEVKRDERNRIVIQGIVPTRRRRAELLGALAEIDGREYIRTELEAAEDLRLAPAAVPLAALQPQSSGPPAGDSEFQQSAKAALRSVYPADTEEEARHRLVGVGNRAIRLSEDAIAEAWAIRRLEERFGGGKLGGQSGELLEIMAGEHLRTLRSQVAEMDHLLAPMLSRMAFEQAGAPASGDLFPSVERLRRLVQSSLAGSSQALGAPGEVSAEILALTKSLSVELADIDAVVSRIFP